MAAAEISGLAIEVRDVCKQYGRGKKANKVLKNINVDVPHHSIYALLGASGCGKTTLLRCCLGFIRPNKGKIVLMGNPPGARGTNIPGKDLGYMPQDIALVNELSTLETMYFFGIMFRMGFKQIRNRAQFLGNLLELPPLNKRIKEMSGGEQRRVSFAVSLIQQPPLLILDEPTVGMDFLLRQSVWQYIEELTAAKECTVVITTHDVNEARRANTVALMRSGKLLTQAKPDDLIRAHNAVTMEEVFVKLAYEQEKDEKKLTTNIDQNTDTKPASHECNSKDGTTKQYEIKKLNFVDNHFPRYLYGVNLAIALAIAIKTGAKTMRSVFALLMVLLLPVINLLGVVYFIGGDVKNVKMFYQNYEQNSTYIHNFISDVGATDEFDLEQVSLTEVEDKISDGDGPLGFVIESNFTESLLSRYRQVCKAHFNSSVDYPSINVIQYSTIGLYIDATDTELFTQSMLQLNTEGEIFLNSIFNKTFRASYDELFQLPIQLVDEVFGSVTWEYSDYLGSATITGIIFGNAVALTSMNFILERKGGLFERSYAAGASVTDFLLAYTVHSSVILIVQIILLMVSTFVILGVERVGNIFLFAFIVWLSGMIGFALGICLSSQIIKEIAVQNAAQLLGGLAVFISGGLWPVYGQPALVKTIGSVLPITQPTTTASAIATKGLGLSHEPVYLGFITAITWVLVVFIVSITFFRTE